MALQIINAPGSDARETADRIREAIAEAIPGAKIDVTCHPAPLQGVDQVFTGGVAGGPRSEGTTAEAGAGGVECGGTVAGREQGVGHAHAEGVVAVERPGQGGGSVALGQLGEVGRHLEGCGATVAVAVVGHAGVVEQHHGGERSDVVGDLR